MEGWQIIEEAWQAFDKWRAEQTDEVQELDIVAQINLYYAASTQVEAA
jgi:hypothetical protein